MSSATELAPDNELNFANEYLPTIVKKLYLDKLTADVYFEFGNKEGERVPAHKNLLSAGSDVFNVMFYGKMQEKGNIKIIDASADGFKEFLKFFYFDNVNLSMENIANVVNLGKKYQVAACLKISEQFLIDSLTDDNVCFAYGIAILYELNELKKLCETRISYNTRAVFVSASFLKCPKSVLGHIIKLNRLSCPEHEVFDACMAWIKEASQQDNVTRETMQTQLGYLFYEIRFGSITIDQFVQFISSYGQLFSSDEYCDILKMIRTNYQSKLFKNKARETQWNSDCLIRCSRIKDDAGTSTYNFQSVESITFSTSKPLLLGELACAELNLRDPELKIQVTIIEYLDEETPKIISNEKVILKSGPNQSVLLQKPISIKPYQLYDIQFKQKAANNQFYAKPTRTEVVLLDSDALVEFHGDLSFRGFISALHFNPIPNM